MKISRVNIQKVTPIKNLIGFASVVVDDWLYIGNIAIFTRLGSDNTIRLVFPEKKLKEGSVSIFYPLTREAYYVLEKEVQKKFNELI